MEPACANLARSHFPLSPIAANPCSSRSSVCNTRASSACVLQGNVSIRSSLPLTPPALANHVCSVQNCIHALELNQGLHYKSVSHVDVGWHERLELREFQGHLTRRKNPPTNVICSKAFDNSDGYWFRDQPRIGSSQSSSFGNPASTSGDIQRRCFTWSWKKKSRMRNCRCGSEGLSDDGNDVGAEGEGKYEVSDIPTEESTNRATPGFQSDQTAARAGTLESELFLYTV